MKNILEQKNPIISLPQKNDAKTNSKIKMGKKQGGYQKIKFSPKKSPQPEFKQLKRN